MSRFHCSLALHESFFLLKQNISPVNSVLGHSSVPFSGALADLPVGFPYRFNSSFFIIIKVCLTQSADLSVFVLFFLFFLLLRSARRSLQTFLFLFCFSLFFKVCLTQSADLSVFVLFFLFFYYSFLFFSTATCVLRFLHYFSTNLDEIWHVDSPWWDEQTEYFFKSIGPGVGIRRGPKVLLCFIIGKTLYTVRRDKNFT